MNFLFALSAAVIVMGAIWIIICFTAWDQGLKVGEWLKICDAKDREEGRRLKEKYLKENSNGL